MMAGFYVRKPGAKASGGCEVTGKAVNDRDTEEHWCGNRSKGKVVTVRAY